MLIAIMPPTLPATAWASTFLLKMLPTMLASAAGIVRESTLGIKKGEERKFIGDAKLGGWKGFQPRAL